ncbi:MAG: hypothetical protein HYZ45_06335 [Burkholderiales bacterium]|nr:hypothetical protein [Burkholderiales bacterium]
MRHHPQRSLPQQVFVGLMIMAIGLIFLLDNFGWWDAQRILHYWPVLLIVVGAMKLSDAPQTKQYFVGMALIAVGAGMTLQRLGLFIISWKMMWPIIIMLAGIAFIIKAVVGQDGETGQSHILSTDTLTSDDSFITANVVMGGVQRRVITPNFKGGKVNVVMGGCELDLRQCGLEGDATLEVHAVFGGVEIKVPMDWAVILKGTPILGGFDEKTVAPPDSSKRLIITGTAIMGGVNVRNPTSE